MDVGLARVSTLDQDPRLQITALERAGCDPILEERVSGASEKRPVRDRALRMLQRGDTLTTWKLDRLGRSVIDLHTVVADLKARGVAWRSLTEQIDTTHAQGELFFAILAAFAQFERALIIERTTAAKQAMIGDGRHPGGPRAFGFAADHTTIVEAEADLLREAARRVLAREPAGVSGIVDAWNQRDVPSASGGRWVVTSLRRQLVNPRSIPILGAQTHRELVKLFSDAGRRRMGAPATHLLSGILRCGSCEQWLYGGHVQGDRWVYRCRKTSGGRFKAPTSG